MSDFPTYHVFIDFVFKKYDGQTWKQKWTTFIRPVIESYHINKSLLPDLPMKKESEWLSHLTSDDWKTSLPKLKEIYGDSPTRFSIDLKEYVNRFAVNEILTVCTSNFDPINNVDVACANVEEALG